MRKLFFCLFALSIYSCNQADKTITDTTTTKDSTKTDSLIVSENDTVALMNLSTEILTCLKNSDFKCLSEYVHPKEGLLFSPYGYVDTSTNKVFTKEQVAVFSQNSHKINWGPHDALDEEIILTGKDYLKKYVYDVDFLNAPSKTANRVFTRGTTPNNIESAYPGYKFTDFFFPGFEEKYDGMDWRALRLVFKNENGKNYLVGIIHDEWTT